MIVLPPLAYAEIHYRFKYFFSYLKNREPEILADVPHRLEPRAPLPVLLLVKDADRYPVKLLRADIEVRSPQEIIATKSFTLEGSSAKPVAKYMHRLLLLDLPPPEQNTTGPLEVRASIEYESAGRRRVCISDNYRTSSHAPLRVYRARDPLPSLPGWVLGDVHIHTSYTEDQVEFGVPLPPAVDMCRAMGLSFFCTADHSYDLDDSADSYLGNDPSLPKWNALQAEIESLNSARTDFAIVRGEEVSCRNDEGRNVHLLLHGNRRFVHGSGDSAERWLRTRSEHAIEEVLKEREQGALAYASHPTETAPFLQKLLLHRGHWELDDLRRPGLSGMQVLNGEDSGTFASGLEAWSTLLLEGRRLFITAGNDAHGNFSRFRQIGIPFLRIAEDDKQLFGRMRTALYSPRVDEEHLLAALRTGQATVTNGPFVALTCRTSDGEEVMSGSEVRASRTTLLVEGMTTEEFGRFSQVQLIVGRPGKDDEEPGIELTSSGGYHVKAALPFTADGPSYVRVEAYTERGRNGSRRGFAISNPIWITPSDRT